MIDLGVVNLFFGDIVIPFPSLLPLRRISTRAHGGVMKKALLCLCALWKREVIELPNRLGSLRRLHIHR